MKRVLAIDPITRGFGFAVLDGPHSLIDWGLKGTSRWQESREQWCLRQVAELIDFYRPDRVVVEDCLDRRSRRGRKSEALIDRIVELAGEHHIPVRRISRTGLRRAFTVERACTKYKIALAIAGRFPELAWRLPPIRKPWMSEDTRMGIFDAVGLALAFYARRPQSGSSDAVSVSALKGGEITPSIIRRR
jgi:Holliday junction resolvasome RuvABC endonuclease subunit